MNVHRAIQIAQDSDRLAVLQQIKLLDTVAEEAFDKLTRLASKILNSPISLVSLIDADRQFFKSMFGLPEPWASMRETPLSHSFCMHVVADNAPLIVEDAREHPVFRHNLAVPDLDVVAYLGMPLTTTDGVGLGSFCVIDTKPRHWTEDEIGIMRELAFSIMTEIELKIQIEKRQQTEAAMHQYVDSLELMVEERTQELKQAYGHLQKVDQFRAKFIDGISHEFRTPLANLSLYLSLLAKGQPERRAHYLNVLDEQLKRLTSLVLGIVQYSQLDLENTFMSVNLNDIVEKVFTESQQRQDKENVQLLLTAHSFPIHVLGNPELLTKAVANLVHNALQYSSQGEVRISTFVVRNPERACLLVEDSGMGIASEDIPYLFDGFFRGQGVSQSNLPGIGLGLTVVKEIVELHEGQIEIESQTGVGSQFRVYFPLVYL